MHWLILTSADDSTPRYVNLQQVALMLVRGPVTRIFFNSVAGATLPAYYFVDVTETPDSILALAPVITP